uniref:Uncharacterized protein n=1 Tax=Sphaerodactylus townsendi TaxID=933632 RepID=A0ACB8F386_9SAUR
MEAERCGPGPAPPLIPSSGPPRGDEAAAPTLVETHAGAQDSAGPAILPSSPELLDFDDDEDLEVFSKVP